jgi:hypothetical protein
MDKPNKTDLRIEHTIDTPVRFLMRQVRRRVTLLQPILGFIGTGSYRIPAAVLSASASRHSTPQGRGVAIDISHPDRL